MRDRKEVIEIIRNMAVDGATYREIHDKVPEFTVPQVKWYTYKSRQGVFKKKKKPTVETKRVKISRNAGAPMKLPSDLNQNKIDRIRMLSNFGYTCSEVANEFGYSVNDIKKILKVY
jgi:hypothetical protein